jgi:hypothetical protein
MILSKLFITDTLELQVLALDGLGTASSCRRDISPVTATYELSNKFSHGIPNCLFSMPNLTLLHLSGNELTGQLPSDKALSSTLSDLSLAYNFLTGEFSLKSVSDNASHESNIFEMISRA